MPIEFRDENEKRGGASTLFDQLRKLDSERERLVEDARNDALARVETILGELRELGLEYELVERGQKGGTSRALKSRSAGTKATGQRGGKPCPICEFTTDPPHDARRHRSQKNKAPFTDDELEGMGLVRA